MKLTASKLRQNIYRILDQVLETGLPVIVVRKGKIIEIRAQAPKSKLEKLKRRSGVIQGNPDDLIHIDWSSEWSENR